MGDLEAIPPAAGQILLFFGKIAILTVLLHGILDICRAIWNWKN